MSYSSGVFLRCELNAVDYSRVLLFDPIEAGIAKPDPVISEAAIRGRIGPQLEVLRSVYDSEFEMLGRVLNGSGKAPNRATSQSISSSQQYESDMKVAIDQQAQAQVAGVDAGAGQAIGTVR
jgi:hypothetical protein